MGLMMMTMIMVNLVILRTSRLLDEMQLHEITLNWFCHFDVILYQFVM